MQKNHNCLGAQRKKKWKIIPFLIFTSTFLISLLRLRTHEMNRIRLHLHALPDSPPTLHRWLLQLDLPHTQLFLIHALLHPRFFPNRERRDWYLFQLSNWSANCLNLWEATAKGNLYQNALVP